MSTGAETGTAGSSRLARAYASRDGRAARGLVEFALVLPVLMLVIVGIIKVGIVYNNYLTLNDAVRAGARQFAMGRGTANACTPAINRVKSSSFEPGPDEADRHRAARLPDQFVQRPAGRHRRQVDRDLSVQHQDSAVHQHLADLQRIDDGAGGMTKNAAATSPPGDPLPPRGARRRARAGGRVPPSAWPRSPRSSSTTGAS